MAVITFPAAPTPGDVYEANGVTYRYDGTVTDGKWVSLGTSNGGNTDDIVYDNGLGADQVSRILTARLNDYVSVKDFGATGDGTTDDSDNIQEAIEYCIANDKVLIFGNGEYLIQTPIVYTFTAANKNLYLELGGAYIIADTGTNTTIAFEGATFDPKVKIAGPGYVDGTRLDVIPGDASGTFMRLERFSNVEVSGITFDAGTWGNGQGDSAITMLQCENVIVSECQFKGWDDHALYLTGAALGSPIEMVDTVVTGCVFNDISGAIRWAREASGLLVSGNVFTGCGNSVVAAGGATNYNAGNSIVVTGNLINNSRNTPISARYFPEGVTVTGNSFYDWWRNTPNTAGDSTAAVSLLGVSNSVVTGNIFGTKNPNNNPATDLYNAVGVYMNSAVNPIAGAPSTVYPANNNLISSNYFQILQVDNANGGRNAAIVDLSTDTSSGFTPSTNSFTNNKIVTAGTAVAYWIQNESGQNVAFGQPCYIHPTDEGFGIGTDNPNQSLEVVGGLRTTYSDNDDRYIDHQFTTNQNQIWSYSPVDNAKKLYINATTDSNNTEPTGGELGVNIRIGDVDKFKVEENQVTSNAAFRLRNNATAQLPTGVETGSLVYDTTTNTVKVYNGTDWVNV